MLRRSCQYISHAYNAHELVIFHELFNYDQKRHDKARILFRLIEEKGVLIVEPEIVKIQVESARKFGVEAYYLLEEFEKVKEEMEES
jgi:hypothetical protein